MKPQVPVSASRYLTAFLFGLVALAVGVAALSLW